ncbi:hypothetical protein HUJ05_005225 [Dendroctonus ponderosae]|nr:hypothetical protein HUJ05_005225 [Dendroctonus ponderosae]
MNEEHIKVEDLNKQIIHTIQEARKESCRRSACLLKGTTPSQWTNAVIIIMHKKGNVTDLRNYRPISLLSHVYMLFMAVITKRLTNKLDSYQPCEQAGFRFGNNYEKAFDTVDQHEMLLALADCRIDHCYITLIKNIYDTAIAHVRLQADTDKFNINLGIRQGDTISPRRLGDNEVQQVTSYKYLGHEIRIGRDNQTFEIFRRIGLTWAAFGNFRESFKSELPICLKRKLFNQCVLPVMTYGAETLTLTKKSINNIRTTQVAKEKSMLGVSLSERIHNRDIRRRTGVTDAVTLRELDDRWTRKIIDHDVRPIQVEDDPVEMDGRLKENRNELDAGRAE